MEFPGTVESSRGGGGGGEETHKAGSETSETENGLDSASWASFMVAE